MPSSIHRELEITPGRISCCYRSCWLPFSAFHSALSLWHASNSSLSLSLKVMTACQCLLVSPPDTKYQLPFSFMQLNHWTTPPAVGRGFLLWGKADIAVNLLPSASLHGHGPYIKHNMCLIPIFINVCIIN